MRTELPSRRHLLHREFGPLHGAHRTNDAQGNKFTFGLSEDGPESPRGRFASEAEHTACPISRHDLGSGPKREDIHDHRKKGIPRLQGHRQNLDLQEWKSCDHERHYRERRSQRFVLEEW